MKVSASKSCNESKNKKTALNKKTAPTFLLLTMFDWIDVRMNGSDDVLCNQWEDKCEWWNMKATEAKMCNEWIHTIISQKKSSYPDFTDNIQWNRRKGEWELCSMKVSALKICYESNHMKIAFIWKTTVITSLLSTMFY